MIVMDQEILNTDMPAEPAPLLLTFNQDDNNHNIIKTDGTTAEKTSESNKSFDPPMQTVVNEHAEEPSNTTMNFDINYLLDQPYFDATSDFPLDDTLFFEANDLKNDVDSDSGLDILDGYMSFYNDNIAPDSSLLLEGTHQEPNQDLASSSSKKRDPNQETDIAYPFLKKASYMLENISAPPAFASEFPAKYMLASGSQGQSSVNVITSGMIHISNMSFGGGAMDLSLGKNNTQLNIVVSFDVGQSGDSGKVSSGGSRSWFYSGFLWILVASLSFKIGSLVCPRSFMS